MGRGWVRWAALAAAAVVGLAGCSAGADAVATGQTFEFVAPAGQTRIFYDPPEARVVAPELGGEDLLRADVRIGVSEFAGQVVVLNIWGSWCGPCRTEMPELQRVFQRTQDSGARFLGIDIRDNDRAAPQDFVRALGIGYPSIYDPPGRSLLELTGYPRNVATVPGPAS